MVKEILPQLERKGGVVRGWLGVAVQPVTPELADALDLETQSGALIAGVTEGGPADEGGLERGDVIVRFGTQQIDRMRDLPRTVAAAAPGEKVEVEFVREGKLETRTVKIAQLSDEKERAATANPAESDRGSTDFGLDIGDVPGNLRQQLGLGDSEGAVITRVYGGGSAERAGLRPGDVIVELDRQPVSGGLDAERKFRAAKEKALVVVRREEGSFFAVVARRPS
jgi:serine protease Do